MAKTMVVHVCPECGVQARQFADCPRHGKRYPDCEPIEVVSNADYQRVLRALAWLRGYTEDHFEGMVPTAMEDIDRLLAEGTNGP